MQDPDGFQRELRHAYDACRQAIQDELNRQLNPPEVREPQVIEEHELQREEEPDKSVSDSTPGSAAPVAMPPAKTTPATTSPATLGLVQTKPRASQRQLNYVHHLAHGISG